MEKKVGRESDLKPPVPPEELPSESEAEADKSHVVPPPQVKADESKPLAVAVVDSNYFSSLCFWIMCKFKYFLGIGIFISSHFQAVDEEEEEES